MAITTDGLRPNQFNKAISGVSEGFVWASSDTNYFSRTINAVERQEISKGISVAESGLYAFTMASGSAVTVFLAAGVIHPIHAKRFLAAGTTGTGTLIVWM